MASFALDNYASDNAILFCSLVRPLVTIAYGLRLGGSYGYERAVLLEECGAAVTRKL